MSGKRIYGIDLGTTYSCIACVDEHGQPVVIPNAESERTTPSVVYFEGQRSIVSGQAAKDAAIAYHDRVVSTVKRKMGDPNWAFPCDGVTYRPQEISAFILRKLVGDARQSTGEDITDVVITCPAYFGIEQKEATRQAGEIAGLNVHYIIPEPTAAAIAYGMQQERDQTLLVYDLGGGTFDITLIEIKDGAINVIATGGDDQLGGKDWDEAIVNYLAERFQAETGTPASELLDNMETLQELMNAAEKAKKGLTSRQSFTHIVRHGGGSAKVEITRAKFEELTAGLLERTVSFTQEMIERARSKGHAKIDKLLLVGGSTRMPQVLDRLKRFPFEIKHFDPDEAVAKGAALFGMKCLLDDSIRITIAEQTGQPRDQIDLAAVPEAARRAAEGAVARKHGFALPDLRKFARLSISIVTSKSFGLIVRDEGSEREVVNNLVVVDDPVPREVSKIFGTFADNQMGVEVRIMENHERAGDKSVVPLDRCTKKIGSFDVPFPRALPRDSPIEVIFKLSPDGLLSVFAKDLTTGQSESGEWKTDCIMTREEVQEARSRNLVMKVS